MLKVHQETTKACLALLEEIDRIIKEFRCNSCDKNFTSLRNLNIHLNSCKNMNQTIKKELDDMKQLFNDGKNEIQSLKIALQEKDKEIDRLSNLVKEAIKKPTVINKIDNSKTDNRSINIVSFLKELNKPMTMQVLLDSVVHLTLDHCLGGGYGLASYAIKYPLSEAPIVCTDVARKNFSYLEEKDGDQYVSNDRKLYRFNPKFFQTIKDRSEELLTGYLTLKNFDMSNPGELSIIIKVKNIISNINLSSQGEETRVSRELVNVICNQLDPVFIQNKFNKPTIIEDIEDRLITYESD